ncbi:insulinoma-associated protein 2 [Sphaerodactylus townsendi]|uniref:insulinoma-associated protein 2 n=1 Tax=Sphaerodactylus townsendi TaxID=933632 RepID=UPI002025CCE3|nr:insulinoma-associated protein 2 [Sphaerodactylus townsendi]
MPRGFLVKRSRRPGGSYRLRPPAALPDEAPDARAPFLELLPPPPPPDAPLTAAREARGSDCAAVRDAEEPQAGARSPASAEPFPPSPAPHAEEERLPRTPLPLLLLPAPASPPAAAPLGPPKRPPPRAKAPPAKKPKAARRLSFADEVTTSPVLGLRIKAAPEEAVGQGPPSGRAAPLLGEFVCQLCKEPYADPLALAQHRCSRIVRVEYRCPECHKIFSCPANLASHRRWHKPRPPAAAGPAARDKENSRASAQQHPAAPDSACCRHPAATAAATDGPGLPPGGGGGELFLCPYCRKTFRRQAYLRKHLGTHQGPPGLAAYRTGPPPPPRASPPPTLAFPCPLCGAPFPSADLRDKHRLWHAVREELLLPLGPPEGTAAPAEPPPQQPPPPQQIFSCKHCPAAFFSSPGLTRHINKCHPSENRQVLLLQMPLRPGC